MKRTTKNKVYQFIGQAVVYSTLYLSTVTFSMWAFCQNTIY